MNILCLDFETFFSKEYTLKKLTTEAYVRDSRFEILGCGIHAPWLFGEHYPPVRWFADASLREFFKTVPWDKCAVLCHHSHFDGLILAHHYGVRPAFHFDTLSMGRLMHGNALSLSLGALAAHYGLGAKNVPYDLFEGKRWLELDVATRVQVAEGCMHDVELTLRLFQLLAREFPQEEYYTIDTTIRMFTEPTLRGDTKLFEQVRDEEWQKKTEMLAELGVEKAQLQSPAKFCELLVAEDVVIEYKPGKNKPNPAVAKTDQFMKDLLDSPNPRVAALAEARLEVRSTIDETRAGRLAGMSSRGPLCVYLVYAGAHTARWSGGDKLNFQNLPASRTRGGALRRGIKAPNGYLLGIIDKSQIEDRMLCMCARQWDAVEDYRQGKDPYVGLASEFYGFEVNKKEHPTERGTGKQMKLSCGFGSGPATFQRTAARGQYGPPIQISLEDAQEAVRVYKTKNKQIVAYWREAEQVLAHLADGLGEIQWGPVTVEKGRIIGPNGMPMLYELEWDAEERGWRRRTRRGWVHVWGGVLVQNMMEFLCRINLSQDMIRIRQEGFRIVMCTHDELVVLIPDDTQASAELEWVMEEMRRAPLWMPGIPLDVEGHLSEIYDK